MSKAILFIFSFSAFCQLNEDSLLLHLPFNNSFIDASGNNNTTINYGTTFVRDRDGNSKSAVYFDGKDDYIEIINKDHFQFGVSDFTISFWLKYPPQKDSESYPAPGRVTDYGLVLIKTDKIKYPYEGITFFVDYPSSGEVTFRTSGANEMSYPIHLNDDQWHFYALKRKSEELSLFIDGKKIITGRYPVTDVSNEANIRIGANHIDSLSQNLYGSLDGFRIYSKALKDEEIVQMFN